MPTFEDMNLPEQNAVGQTLCGMADAHLRVVCGGQTPFLIVVFGNKEFRTFGNIDQRNLPDMMHEMAERLRASQQLNEEMRMGEDPGTAKGPPGSPPPC